MIIRVFSRKLLSGTSPYLEDILLRFLMVILMAGVIFTVNVDVDAHAHAELRGC